MIAEELLQRYAVGERDFQRINLEGGKLRDIDLSNWLSATSRLEATALRDLSLRDAQDIAIFEAARAENAVIMTKDSDFVDLVCRLGTPPQILWLTCGNVTNRNLRQL